MKNLSLVLWCLTAFFLFLLISPVLAAKTSVKISDKSPAKVLVKKAEQASDKSLAQAAAKKAAASPKASVSKPKLSGRLSKKPKKTKFSPGRRPANGQAFSKEELLGEAFFGPTEDLQAVQKQVDLRLNNIKNICKPRHKTPAAQLAYFEKEFLSLRRYVQTALNKNISIEGQRFLLPIHSNINGQAMPAASGVLKDHGEPQKTAAYISSLLIHNYKYYYNIPASRRLDDPPAWLSSLIKGLSCIK